MKQIQLLYRERKKKGGLSSSLEADIYPSEYGKSINWIGNPSLGRRDNYSKHSRANVLFLKTTFDEKNANFSHGKTSPKV